MRKEIQALQLSVLLKRRDLQIKTSQSITGEITSAIECKLLDIMLLLLLTTCFLIYRYKGAGSLTHELQLV